MWALLTAEIRYNRVFFFSASAGLAAVAFLRHSDALQLETAFSLSWMILLFAISFLSSFFYKNKRERFWATLPVSAGQAGAARTFLHIALFAIFIVFWLSILPLEKGSDAANDFGPYVSANGLVFNAYLVAFIVRDLAFRRNKNKSKLAVFFAVSYFALFAIAVFNRDNASLPLLAAWVLNDPIFPFLCAAPLPFLVALSIKTYASREFFLS